MEEGGTSGSAVFGMFKTTILIQSKSIPIKQVDRLKNDYEVFLNLFSFRLPISYIHRILLALETGDCSWLLQIENFVFS